MSMSQVFASYTKQPIQDYAGNPLIEALPPILTEEAAMVSLGCFPPIPSQDELDLDCSLRIHCVDRLRSVIQPLLIHLELQSIFSSLIRWGYVGRNPRSPDTVRHLHSLSKSKGYHSGFKSTAETFSLVGLSGIGKSTALESILSLYPQTIKHTQYEGKQFVHTQISWLKLDCPRDGSLSGFCQQFFISIGEAIGDKDYPKRYRARNINDALQQMEQVASNFYIGALLIDEIQNLHLAKTGGKDSMLNFFLHLVNNLGIPVVFIGTNSMVSLFSDVMRNARRTCGLGVVEFKHFQRDDEEWRNLVETLWSYQWCRQRAGLTDEIYDALYDRTQGVTDFLVKLLVLTQRYAIQSGEERITAASIRMVSDSKMKILAPALSALRSRDPKAMSRFEDLLPVDAQLAEMMTPDPGSSGARLKMLRTYSSGALASAANPETKPVVHAAVAVTEEHELLGISQSDDPLQSLREAGWINQDIFEFSPAYRKS
ncbi:MULTISPECIES: ATP-binding protein [Pseudomonadaceae]|uniref:ATP-binding protein n=1 Tax=Pseudomonadaceae TaxID=135621 RepID=UPI0025D7EF62|nr:MULTISPECIES: AAA family ATPase [Pseudomonadaceae]